MAEIADPSFVQKFPFVELPDLAAERVGGAVVWANDEFFAEKENLLKPQKAVFIDGKYTDRGKWMDGWETRRRRTPGHDLCILRLGLPGVIRGVVVDTAFFRGNYPQACSIEGASFAGQPTISELCAPGVAWTEVLARSDLRGDSPNAFACGSTARFTHLRFNIFPDGGVARLRIHGDVVPLPRWMGKPGAEVDLAALEYGAKVVLCNDMFFGSRHNLILPGPSLNMGDGWETRRSRKEAPDWALVELAAQGTIDHIEVDTSHFKGNFPESCAIYGLDLPHGKSLDGAAAEDWVELLPRTTLQAHTRHHYENEITARGPFTHLRLDIFPDGGIARLRVFGVVTESGRTSTGLRHLALAPTSERRALLRATCGSTAWVDAMMKAPAWDSREALLASSERAFDDLQRDDWLEAFRAHPKIGERKAAVATGARAAAWAGGEQAMAATSTDAVKEELATINLAYEARFGFLYIVCATGRTANEMLDIAKTRMKNDPAQELGVAAIEQRKITALRLAKLVSWL